jgi:cell division septal protein FtsQ
VRRNRRRRDRTRVAVARAILRGGSWLLVIAISAGAATRLAAWARAHPYFALREIDVEGAAKIDGKTVLEWAALSPGMSIWSVSEHDAERRLLAEGRIRAASVERTLPGRVTIRIEERQPIAVLLGSRPVLVAADGTVFPPLAGEPIDGLPYLTGIGGELDSPLADERLRQVAAIVSHWQKHADWPAISEVRPEGDDLVVFVAGTPLAVRFSVDARLDDFTRLSAVLDLWRGREAVVAAIDVSMPGQAVMKLRRGKARIPALQSGFSAIRGRGDRPRTNTVPRRGSLPLVATVGSDRTT